jgi:hypothetical protein
MSSEEKLSSLITTLLKNIDNLAIPNQNNAEVSGESKTIIINILKMITNLCNNYLDLLHESNHDFYDGFYFDYKRSFNKLTIDSCSKSQELFTFYKTVCMRLLNNEYDKYDLKLYILYEFLYFAKNTYNKTRMVNIIKEHIKELQRLKKKNELKEQEKLILYENLNKLLKNIDEIRITDNGYSSTSLQESKGTKELLIHILKMMTENGCNDWLNLIHKYNGKDNYDKYLENMNNNAHMEIIFGCINSKSEEMNKFFKDDRKSSFYSEAKELYNFCSKILHTELYNEEQKNQLKIDILKGFTNFANNTKGKKEFVDIINEFIKNLLWQKSQSQSNKSRTGQKSSSLLSYQEELQGLNELEELRNPSTGGKTIKINKTKLLFGKERCIYKKSGDRKEYIKYKGDLITVKEYKIIIKNRK